jgi:hypothetical protein
MNDVRYIDVEIDCKKMGKWLSFLLKQLLKTKTRYFSGNFQVQGLIFSLIVYQFEVSLHPLEAYISYILTANLIIQDSPSKYS